MFLISYCQRYWQSWTSGKSSMPKPTVSANNTMHRNFGVRCQAKQNHRVGEPGMCVQDLYLELLKKVLTNTLFDEEPDVNEEEHRFVTAFVKHYIKSPAITMLPIVRLHNIQHCVRQVIEDNVPGDLIETGVW